MQLTWLTRTRKVEPYSQVAYIYDDLMRHVNYSKWANYLARVFQRAESSVNTILDVSCGTGSLVLNLARLGFEVAGFDFSRHMVTIAKAKAREHTLCLPFWQGSMAAFCVKRKYHAVICTYDSINYCLEPSLLKAVLHCAHAALGERGIFVFDVSTLRNSRKNFKDFYDEGEVADYEYVRQSQFLFDKHHQVNEFHITRKGDKTTYRETHVQRIYSIEEIRHAIPLQMFRLTGIYEGFSFRTGTDKSDRVHFALTKA